MSEAAFFKRTLIVVAVVLVPLLIWYLFSVVMVALGALILAILLQLGAEPLMRWLRLPRPIALTLSICTLVAVFVGAAYLFGARLSGELQDLFQRAGTAQGHITASLQQSHFGRLLLSHLSGGSLSVRDLASSLFSTSATFLEALVVLVVTGLYFAAQPELYRDGLIRLFPPKLRPEATETVHAIGVGLRRWLIGQLIQMVLVGLLTTLAVWLIGLPSPFALGVIAALAEFIPYLGPIIASIPAILVAITKDLSAIIWTVVAYLMIHQIEGNLFVPLIQRQMIFIPPAVILLGIASVWFLFGAVSTIFAAPISVIVFVALKKLYVQDTLHEPTQVIPTVNQPG